MSAQNITATRPPRDYIRYLHPAPSGTTRAWIKEISTVAPTKALLRAAARCNLFYGFSHKFLSHWDRRSCLSFTPVSAHSLLQHQSVIASASGPWTRPFCRNYKSLAASAWHNSQICLIRFACLSIRGRPINHICEDMGMIFCETKVCYCTKNTLGAVFFAPLQPCKIAKSPWLQPLKVTYSVLSAFLLFHLGTKGTLAENSLDFGTAVKRPAFNCFRWLKRCNLNPTVSDLDLACLEPVAPHVVFFCQ